MIQVNTNIYSSFSGEDFNKIIEKVKDLDEIKFGDYETKSPDEDMTKFILKDINLKKCVSSPSLWETLTTLIQELYFYSKNKVDEKAEVQIWIIDTLETLPVNVTFSIQEWTDLSDLMKSLKSALINSNLGEIKTTGAIIWLSYNTDKKDWSMKVY